MHFCVLSELCGTAVYVAVNQLTKNGVCYWIGMQCVQRVLQYGTFGSLLVRKRLYDQIWCGLLCACHEFLEVIVLSPVS